MSDPARTPERMDTTANIRTAWRFAGFCSMQWLGVRSNENRCLTMRASSHKVLAYETTNTILRLLRPRRLLRSHLRRVENLKTPRTGRCQSAANAARPSGARSAVSVANRRRRTARNCGLSCSDLDASRKCLRAPKDGIGTRESEARVKCPKCGHVFKATNQIKGGKARWSGMSKAERKQAASAAAKARWARTPNDRTETPPTSGVRKPETL